MSLFYDFALEIVLFRGLLNLLSLRNFLLIINMMQMIVWDMLVIRLVICLLTKKTTPIALVTRYYFNRLD